MFTVGHDAGAVDDTVVMREVLRPHSADGCMPQRVLVVDEHPLVRAGLRAVLAGAPWVTSCLVAASAAAAWQVVQQRRPQLVLISASLGGRSGFALCRALKERIPDLKIVLMSEEAPVSAALARRHGAVASLPKQLPAAAMIDAIKRVVEGGRVFPKDPAPSAARLSKRELDVLQHVASGLSNPEVAVRLNLSRWTVKQHTSAVYRKLGVRNRAEAASRAQQLGLIA
ncbi:response regulator transcription factor [[Mycobacterium] burgundiense]|uniref:Response regulator transcription factor n=1 Tax=[Mycobacterium] burgundiense TaxID=3064286 RepID=A0ABM9M7A2_9MYCO|nr:response regulator transcription factor [Mycolicibacterium sp. MU0053]CAJ1511077.1 response regulator transcription factor [Mycolicibacterium sp. MU0053]